MARVNFAVGAGASDDSTPVVEAAFFGGNFLFDRDKVGEEGTWDEKADALDLGLIRFPGGTITERFFDLNNPNQTMIDGAHGGDVLGLSDFLAYANQTGAPVSLVLPTIRYMDALREGAMSEAEIRAELAAFLEALKAGAYGDAALLELVEIGNEFYDRSVNPDGTAAEYGALARIFAEEIRGVFGDKVKIAVQAGQTEAQNAGVIEGFGEADALVDTVIFHDYPWDLAQARDHQDMKSALVDAWTGTSGLAETVFLSEWSISNQYRDGAGEKIGADRIEDGMARAVATLDIAGAYIAAGVDYAAVWPIQQNTRGDLAGDEGQTAETDGDKLSENGLTLVGEAFRLMSEILPGMAQLEARGAIDLDGLEEQVRYRDEIFVQAYEDADKLVLFVSAWALEAGQIGAEIALTPEGAFGSYDIVSLTADGDPLNPNADPVLTGAEGLAFDGEIVARFDDAYAIQRIVLHKIAQQPVEAVESLTMVGGRRRDEMIGGEGDDSMDGGQGNDVLEGGAGDDLLNGGAGNDFLSGGDGFDFLIGGDRKDTLEGGAGADTLDGGTSRDVLNGGAGDDALLGGGGGDRLDGGEGADNLSGGGARDVLRAGLGDDTLSGDEGNDRLFGEDGNDLLLGGAGRDRLDGGDGADTLDGGAGRDVATGGAGADVFVFGAGDSRMTVTDFELGVDHIVIDGAAGFDELTIEGRRGDAVVLVDGDRLILKDVSADDLTADDFIF